MKNSHFIYHFGTGCDSSKKKKRSKKDLDTVRRGLAGLPWSQALGSAWNLSEPCFSTACSRNRVLSVVGPTPAGELISVWSCAN